MFTVTANRRGRKPIVATFATRAAMESACRGWLRYYTLSIVED